MPEWMTYFIEWFQQYLPNLLLSVIAIGVYFLIRRIMVPRLEAYVERDNLKQHTFHSALFTFSVFSAIVTLVLLLLIWGFDVRELLAVSAGIIALTGVALFATWSILSNVTAFFILLSHRAYRRGNYIRVLEADNYIEGYISDINLFNTILITENREIIVYPNNLLIARATIINPRERFHSLGKTEDFRKRDAQQDVRLDEQD